jgi:hypothetical protein
LIAPAGFVAGCRCQGILALDIWHEALATFLRAKTFDGFTCEWRMVLIYKGNGGANHCSNDSSQKNIFQK